MSDVYKISRKGRYRRDSESIFQEKGEEELEIFIKSGWLLCLTAAALEDLKTRQVSVWILFAAMIPGLWNLCCSDIEPHLWSALAGIVMLVLSRMTEGALGEGDGWFFLVCALYWKWWEVWILLLGGLGIGSIWGTVLFLYRRWNQGSKKANATIPLLTCVWPVGIWLALR